ncbi:AAA family ATPase [Paenibacillus campi]|uniref:AAA family ATPase n=1 Tax=Paenibacillus campi TaxID=3106031 RepID=UPI002AFDD813|nr:AAA family ATPase [Paenibacillus sp. SGZ-1014]
MKLIGAHVTAFKSIDDSGFVDIDSSVTIFVGQNESGKTAFLQALHKAASVEKHITYDKTEDYPRKNLTKYEKEHDDCPAIACILEYQLENLEIKRINEDLEFELLEELTFKKSYKYDGSSTIVLNINQKDYVSALIQKPSLTLNTKNKLAECTSIESLLNILEDVDLNKEETEFLEQLKSKFLKKNSWGLLNYYIWREHISDHIPKFLYFDDYRLLAGKINLNELKRKFDASQTDSSILKDEDKTALSLLRIAQVNLDDLVSSSGYENVKAKLEAISNSITDKVFEYWKQNQELEVEFDIRSDPKDEAPYNTGNNLYVRIRNRKHRVTVPFNQRSKGFIWFFSFIIWFDSIKEQLGTSSDIILLLDEPGLSLHALAQADFLSYIGELANTHQIIYTTHSPFMVPSHQLNQVRMVEDKVREGTKITSNISNSDPKTIFPLQAALGYTIAQNLFISQKNLLVEGPADLIYLKYFSSLLESKGKEFLNPEITIIPVGGLDKLATFVALLGGNDLKLAVLHDYNSKPDAHLESLIHRKLINQKYVTHYGMYRDGHSITKKDDQYMNSDVEDMFSVKTYLQIFNTAYKKELKEVEIKESDLPLNSQRVVERINNFLMSNDIKLRKSGGYNHYLIANQLASKPLPISKVDTKTLNAFENLFKKVNELLSD